MLFAISSITKNFVAASTFKLIEEGILALDDPISKWLPPYNYIDSTITIRQLLNHTSGIYMFFSNQQIWDDLKKDRTKVWRPEEVLNYIKEPYFDPGEEFRYSNTNYLLLAMIIEKVSGSGGNMDGYGLGVQRYRRQIANGEIAYGHSGANIGTSAYMVYLPDYHSSVVVMINDRNHDCTETIVKKIIDILVKNIKSN